jgi:hypothetical protein
MIWSKTPVQLQSLAPNGSDLRVSMLLIVHGARTIAYPAISFITSDLISERGPA